MAQVVDMTSLCGQSQDRGASCAVGGGGYGDENEPPAPETTTMQPPKDEYEEENSYAPESFWLSKDAELDWLDRNAFLDRKDSGKGSNPNTAPSQRFSGGVNLKSTASLIVGLPNYNNYSKPNSQKHNCSHSLFSKPSLSMAEPGSPKVSCMGRVKSRSRSRKDRRIIKNKPVDQPQPSAAKHRKSGFRLGLGFWRSIFRSKRPPSGVNNGLVPSDSAAAAAAETTSCSTHKRPLPSDSHPNAVSLGEMKRFASGRKSDALGEVDGVNSEPLDLPAAGPIWLRREAGPPQCPT